MFFLSSSLVGGQWCLQLRRRKEKEERKKKKGGRGVGGNGRNMELHGSIALSSKLI